MHTAIDQLSDEARERVRRHSKKLFGNQDTLLVAVAVATNQTGSVNATEISWQVRLQANRVRTQLMSFVELGYMDDGAMRERTRWFVKRPSSFWSMCEQVYAELTG